MMKTIKTIIVAMLLLITMPFMAFADNTTNTTTNLTVTTVDLENMTIVDNTTELIVNETPVATLYNEVENDIEVNTTETIEDVEVTETVETIEDEEVTETVETTEDEAITEEDSRLILDNHGAQIRLLQLQNRVDFQVESAGLILGKITQLGKEDQFNMVSLNQNVNELRAISIRISEYDLANKTANETAQEYVALKKESIAITNDFKANIGDGLTEEDKAALKKLINQKDNERKNIKDVRIEKLKDEFNKKQIKEILNKFNINNPLLVQKIENGEITLDEVKNQIQNRYGNLTDEEKANLKAKIIENEIKLKIENNQMKAEVEKEATRIREEQKQRFEEEKFQVESKYLERLKERENQLNENLKEREEQLRENLKEREEQLRENLKEREEQLRENLKERESIEKERFEARKIEIEENSDESEEDRDN